MNILILGGAGFIGQNLVHALLKTRQNRVTIIDNLKTARINLEEFVEYKNLFEFIEADLSTIDDNEFLKICARQHRIYHLASSVGVEYGDKEPKLTVYNNVALVNKIIPLLDRAKKPVIFSSTSEVYGNGPTFKEDDASGIGPSNKLRWAYATSKLMSEFMIRASSFPYTIVRFFNVTGPGQLADYGMVLPKMIHSAKNGKDIVVHGTGEQVRSFCHIDDAITALVKVSEVTGELFNIGNDSPVTMNQLAARVIELTGSTSTIKHVPYDQAFTKEYEDVMYRVPNLDKIKTAVGYQANRSLDDIIRDMM
jgi:UDP-glucose 4-epimerase